MSKMDYIAPELQPVDAAEAVIFAEEDFVAEVQSIIHRMMVAKDISRADLAQRLGVSRARVTQYFAGDGSNLTARTIARIFHALGEQAEVICEWARVQEAARAAPSQERSDSVVECDFVQRSWGHSAAWVQIESYTSAAYSECILPASPDESGEVGSYQIAA
jgi:transcriptional regulator with XRE-family HTH domain